MRAFDLPITHNKLKTRDDVAQSLIDILSPCGDALICGNTGVLISNSAAHYTPRATILEGWSRLLWGLVPLRKGGYNWKDQDKHFEGLINGTDPTDENYWGISHDSDQRIVEMAAIAIALLITPQYYWMPLTEKQKDNLCTWLSGANKQEFTHNNWLYFRILVNLAFEKLGRDEFDENLMESSLVEIENMYEGSGWYRDLVPFDNYNPWAMQFYSIIYYSFRKDVDVERCQRFKDRVQLFAKQYVYTLTKEGSSVAYGRSLTYRFGIMSFFSALSYANIEALPYGVMKGIILRNLRWWFSKPIFDRDGFLTIGYAYPSQLMAEQYNAEGSPYWALKAYLMLAMDENHPFWQSEEKNLIPLMRCKLLRIPSAIMQRTSDDDVIMLNGGQKPAFEMIHSAEKYAKFAYSAHYGFSVASSYYDFSKTGCDSSLYLSDDGSYFRCRRELKVIEKNERYISSLWHPFEDVEILTYLIPCDDFHIRVHKISTKRDLITKEGGFAISRYRGLEMEIQSDTITEKGFSLISMPWDTTFIYDVLSERDGECVIPTPNLNLINSNTLVPVLSGKIDANTKSTYVCLVGARGGKNSIEELPDVKWNESSSTITINSRALKLN